MKVQLNVVAGPDAGRSFEFDRRDRFVIGRAAECQLVINDPYFSRHHCMVEISPPNLLLVDIGAANGIYVNGTRVHEAALKDGDRLTGAGGPTVIEVRVLDDPAPLAATAPAGGLDLDKILGAAPKKARVDVRCLRCGERALEEQPRPRGDNVAWFCAACQEALRHAPVVIPGYQIVRELGCGGMGCVFLAVQERLGRKCAIKQILPRAAMSEKLRQAFLREAAEQARLAHPRIVQVLDLQESKPGIFSLIMEFVDGQSADKLVERGPLEPRLAVTIVAQALEGLGHAHASGVVHRDIKDANLMVALGPEVSVKLADFGLAKSFQESGASGFTRTGEVGGTIAYMPPEQVLNFKYVTPAADIYAMGATLYRLLTGALPHDFPPGVNGLLVVLEQPTVPVLTRNPKVPVALAVAVERALLKDPARRYPSADEMRRTILGSL